MHVPSLLTAKTPLTYNGGAVVRTKRCSGKSKTRNDLFFDRECPEALTYVVCDRDIDTIKGN